MDANVVDCDAAPAWTQTAFGPVASAHPHVEAMIHAGMTAVAEAAQDFLRTAGDQGVPPGSSFEIRLSVGPRQASAEPAADHVQGSFAFAPGAGNASNDDDRSEARFETEARFQILPNEPADYTRHSVVGELGMALAHELNQPLGAIVNQLATADHLARSGDADDRDRLLCALAKASHNSMRAGAIVKRLRSFIERGEADMRTEHAATIVDQAVALLSDDIRQKGIALEFGIADAGVAILADRVQLQQVLFNLLRNAVQALESSGTADPAMSVTASLLPGDRLEIAVEDNGPGIAPDRLGNIFKPSASDKPGGMGVGLSISKRIIEAHGGQLLHAPAVGKGARFSVILPVVPHQGEYHG